ncbi:hypothetical protein Dsin_018618 [Dipteronia sinensis]|uniref:RNase H type-1 domain-containing protein n=1 Tax=Dipteronia sinensis TaxID=43782 RepID=A0AAE0A5M3_9ROSI|nr:hypothetical protein Dsin_018618 [Dipteronia sinensis]
MHKTLILKVQLQKPHGGYITSSIWNSFRTKYVELIKDGIWHIGENFQRDFWSDNWLGVPILDLLGIPDFLAMHLHARVSDFIRDGRWILDDRFQARFPDLCFRIGRIVISPVTDYLVWPHSRECSVSCKMAYSGMFHEFPQWIFDGQSVAFRADLSLVWRSVYNVNRLGIGCMRNYVDDLLILHRFGLSGRPGKAPVIRSVVWSPPAPGWIKVFAFEAELHAASLAINYAWNLGWHRIWLESDSSYVVQLLSIRSDQVTWCVRQAWQRCIHQISHMEFQVSHIFREGNQVVDALSKHALGLSSDS